MDVLQFHVHAQRVYLILVLDDHSRFIVGWSLLQRESMDDAIDVLEESIRRYGKPEALLTDRGATFHTWQGIGRFDRVLEAYGIEHRLAAPEHPQTCGKVEALNKAIQKELIDRVEFRNYLDAKDQIARWIDNSTTGAPTRTSASRCPPTASGRADRVLRRIEGDTPEPSARAETGKRTAKFLSASGDIISCGFGRLVARQRP